jgi:hypothetical protein
VSERAAEAIDVASTHGWMALALDLLWDEYDREAARALLLDEAGRAAVLARVVALAAEAGGKSPATGSVGDNLLMAIVALRVKFPRAESVAKLVKNVTMRTDHDPGRS